MLTSLANTLGGVGLAGIASISLFFVAGGFWGPLNDGCNAVMAVLAAVLAWRLHPWYRPLALWRSRVTLGAAVAGALTATVGSGLVIFRVTGWYLAGLVTSFGYALIGVWLASISQAALRSLAWPRRLAQLGRAAGALMALGFLAGPGILRRVDSYEAAAWWVNLGMLGGLGWLVLLPIWALWFGRQSGARLAARRETAKV